MAGWLICLGIGAIASGLLQIVAAAMDEDSLGGWLVGTAVIGVLLYALTSVIGSDVESQEQAHKAWAASMHNAGCKVTSFAGRDPQPVWTCPDGTAVLQRWRY